MVKIGVRNSDCRLNTTELSGRGRPKDITGVTLACIPSDSQSRSVVYTCSHSGLTAIKV